MSLVAGSWPQESPVKFGSPSFLTIGKRASIRGHYEVGISLGTRHRTKRRIFDLNRIENSIKIPQDFFDNLLLNKLQINASGY